MEDVLLLEEGEGLMPKKKTRMEKGGPAHEVGQATRLAREGYPEDWRGEYGSEYIETANELLRSGVLPSDVQQKMMGSMLKGMQGSRSSDSDVKLFVKELKRIQGSKPSLK